MFIDITNLWKVISLLIIVSAHFFCSLVFQDGFDSPPLQNVYQTILSNFPFLVENCQSKKTQLNSVLTFEESKHASNCHQNECLTYTECAPVLSMSSPKRSVHDPIAELNSIGCVKDSPLAFSLNEEGTRTYTLNSDDDNKGKESNEENERTEENIEDNLRCLKNIPPLALFESITPEGNTSESHPSSEINPSFKESVPFQFEPDSGEINSLLEQRKVHEKIENQSCSANEEVIQCQDEDVYLKNRETLLKNYDLCALLPFVEVSGSSKGLIQGYVPIVFVVNEHFPFSSRNSFIKIENSSIGSRGKSGFDNQTLSFSEKDKEVSLAIVDSTDLDGSAYKTEIKQEIEGEENLEERNVKGIHCLKNEPPSSLYESMKIEEMECQLDSSLEASIEFPELSTLDQLDPHSYQNSGSVEENDNSCQYCDSKLKKEQKQNGRIHDQENLSSEEPLQLIEAASKQESQYSKGFLQGFIAAFLIDKESYPFSLNSPLIESNKRFLGKFDGITKETTGELSFSLNDNQDERLQPIADKLISPAETHNDELPQENALEENLDEEKEIEIRCLKYEPPSPSFENIKVKEVAERASSLQSCSTLVESGEPDPLLVSAQVEFSSDDYFFPEEKISSNYIEYSENFCEPYNFQREKRANSSLVLDAYAILSAGKSPGLDQNYAGVGTHYPLGFFCGDTAAFVLDNGDFCFSQGIGIHTHALQNELNYYTYLYYEYLNHKSGSFNQVSLAFSATWRCLFFDFNAYIPVGETSHCGCTKYFTDYDNTCAPVDYCVTCHSDYIAYQGFDALIGTQFCLPCNYGRIGVGIGPYYLNNCNEDYLFGGKGHIDYQYNDYLSLFLTSSYDCQNEFLFRFGLSLTFPFNCCSKPRCTQRVYRDDIIKVSKQCTYETNY
ncbi:MAG: hypothetical protein VX777_10150 [Chlamydiota bacterium]|nr:hypothetical protein [Chlamydiota bacterium]